MTVTLSLLLLLLLLLLCRYDPVPSGRVNGDDDTAQRRERRVPATVRGRRTGGDMARRQHHRDTRRRRTNTGENASRRWPICFKIRNTLTRARTRRSDAVVKHNDREQPGRQIISAGTIEKHEQRYYYITYIFAQSRRRRHRRRRRRRRDICLSPLFPFPPPTAPHPRTAAHPSPPHANPGGVTELYP